MSQDDEFEKWVDEYGLLAEPHHTDGTLFDVKAAFRAGRIVQRDLDAGICMDIELDKWHLYKGLGKYATEPLQQGRADPTVYGESLGAEGCAAAIREQEIP